MQTLRPHLAALGRHPVKALGVQVALDVLALAVADLERAADDAADEAHLVVEAALLQLGGLQVAHDMTGGSSPRLFRHVRHAYTYTPMRGTPWGHG